MCSQVNKAISEEGREIEELQFIFNMVINADKGITFKVGLIGKIPR